MTLILIALIAVVGVATVFWIGLVHRDIHIWFLPHLRHERKVASLTKPAGTIDVMFCFVDHFEPLAANASDDQGMQRVTRWMQDYRNVAGRFRDADGRHPIHSFFYPEEEYRQQYLEEITALCKGGFGEVEVHLHHDNDTEAGLTAKLERFTKTLHEKHGVLRPQDGVIPFAFIHGNWALDNSRRDGCWCGVNNELVVLKNAGCYADFTLPSAPSDTQTRTINSIYYATDDPTKPKSHDTGVPLAVGRRASGDLLIFQGPLSLHWNRRKLGIWPRVENGDIAPCDIPIEERIPVWVRQHIHVEGRPEWLFIKVHTHGAYEPNADFLFGGELEKLFTHLGAHYNDGRTYRLHYVSAREAYNIAKAAEAGKTGNPHAYRDFVLPRPF
jgi:hypothetical protein